MVRVALVGYTNVGKSTLMNLLTKSDVFAEDKLFATLDTTVRKVAYEGVPFLLTDTVGFIRKLPHHLIESFRSTLDEVRESDILLHVVDVAHPQYDDQIRTVQGLLKEMKCQDKPTLLVFNKIDLFRERNYDMYLDEDGREEVESDLLRKGLDCRRSARKHYSSVPKPRRISMTLRAAGHGNGAGGVSADVSLRGISSGRGFRGLVL